jgi:hypothetical protein
MAFTEFVVPTLKTDPETEATFITELAPFLIKILDTHTTPPKFRYFGKILLENGNDVSGDFRLVVGLGSSLHLPSLSLPYSFCRHLRPCPTGIPFPVLAVAPIQTQSDADTSTEWADEPHFDTFVASENFQIFKDRVLPYSHALPVPQLYNTNIEPGNVFGNALTEVWQVKIGEGNGKVAESRGAWEKFVSAVAEADGINGKVESFQGTSLNLEERRWVSALGWESSEVSLRFLLILLVSRENLANSKILDKRESIRQCSRKGSEEGT